MGMTCSIDDAINKLDIEAMRIATMTLDTLEYLGIKCVAMVREAAPKDSWNDQTGNLRSSIGYVVSHNGEILRQSSFAPVVTGAEGSLKGLHYARQIASQHMGYCLVVVAGMHYAEKVEQMENKTVLANAELYAEAELPRLFEILKRQVAK